MKGLQALRRHSRASGESAADKDYMLRARYDTRPSRRSRSSTWARISSKVIVSLLVLMPRLCWSCLPNPDVHCWRQPRLPAGIGGIVS